MRGFLQQVPVFSLAVLLTLASMGCSQLSVRGNRAGTAPTLGEEQAHIRGTSDPNAPFKLATRTKPVVTPPVSEGNLAAAACLASNLQVYEAAASMNKDERVVRLGIKNRGDSACRLSGYPSIELEDAQGIAMASILVRQTGSSSLSGRVTEPMQNASGSPSGGLVEIILRPGLEASFDIGWSTGEGCPLISRFQVSLPQVEVGAKPGFSGAFTINRTLNVCNGEVRITALRASGWA